MDSYDAWDDFKRISQDWFQLNNCKMAIEKNIQQENVQNEHYCTGGAFQ